MSVWALAAGVACEMASLWAGQVWGAVPRPMWSVLWNLRSPNLVHAELLSSGCTSESGAPGAGAHVGVPRESGSLVLDDTESMTLKGQHDPGSECPLTS